MKSAQRRAVLRGAMLSAAALIGLAPARDGEARESGGSRMPDDLQAPLRDLLDRNAVTDQVSRLGRWLDLKQFDDPKATAALLMPDVALETPGGRSEGLAAVVEQARRHHTEDRTQHLHTNVLVELHGDTAVASANLLVTFVPHAETPDVISQVGTRYHFDLVRTAQGWRFKTIRDQMIWRRRVA